MDGERIILEFIKVAEEPVGLAEIIEYTKLERRSIFRILEKLIQEDKIEAIKAANNKTYYIANNVGMTYGDMAKLRTKSLEMLVPAKAASDDVKEEMEQLKKEIKGIYANIISVMAVFVAIFSIVFVGANNLFQIAKGTWSISALIAFLATEAGIIIAMLIMLWGIKKFLFK